MLRGLYTAHEKAPAIDADVAPEIQSQKVSHKIHKPISQFLPPHLRPSWDRLRTREVVGAFWALPNDVHAVLQAAQIPTTELIPLTFSLLAWASSICLSGQYSTSGGTVRAARTCHRPAAAALGIDTIARRRGTQCLLRRAVGPP